MTTRQLHEHNRSRTEYYANKPFSTAPRIISEHWDEDGVRFYSTEGNKTFIADLYDKFFKVIKTAVTKSKGRNPNTLLAVLED